MWVCNQNGDNFLRNFRALFLCIWYIFRALNQKSPLEPNHKMWNACPERVNGEMNVSTVHYVRFEHHLLTVMYKVMSYKVAASSLYHAEYRNKEKDM